MSKFASSVILFLVVVMMGYVLGFVGTIVKSMKENIFMIMRNIDWSNSTIKDLGLLEGVNSRINDSFAAVLAASALAIIVAISLVVREK